MPMFKITPNDDADMKKLIDGLASFAISYTKEANTVEVICTKDEARYLKTKLNIK